MIEADKLRKIASNLAEIVVRIISLQYEGFQELMTILGYTVLNIVKGVAKMQKHDPQNEMEKFVVYLTDIFEQDKQYQRKQGENEQKSNIIKLN